MAMSIDILGAHRESVQGWRYVCLARQTDRQTATHDENGKLHLTTLLLLDSDREQMH